MANIKTAISMQEALFVKVESIARELEIPRSQVFTLAINEFIQRRENQRLLAKINDAYQDEPEPEEKQRLRLMRKSHRRLVEGEW